jgi:hypothetical protein
MEYTYNISCGLLSDCYEYIASLTGSDQRRLVMCLGKADELKLFLFSSTNLLMTDLHELFNGPKFAYCKLICFEVNELEGGETVNWEEYTPVFIKYDKMVQSINSIMNQEVRIGSVGLVLHHSSWEDRRLYSNIFAIFRSHFTEEECKLLSQRYEENLLKPKEDLANKDKAEQAISQLSEKESTIEEKKPEGNMKGKAPGPKVEPTKPVPQKELKNEPLSKQNAGKGSSGKSSETRKEEISEKAVEEKSQKEMAEVPKPIVEDLTFNDVLNEVWMGLVPQSNILKGGLLTEYPEYLEIVKNGKSPAFSVRYNNTFKTKCLACGKPGFHKCRVQSSNLHRLADIIKAQRNMSSDSLTLNISVFVNDEKLCDRLKEKALSDSSSKGLFQTESVELMECIQMLQYQEEMGKDCLVDCSECKEKTERIVQIVVEDVPKLFVIQLKRFKTELNYSNGRVEKKKNGFMVDLNPELEIRGKKFRLFGVVNHFGEIDKGHYTANVLREHDMVWFKYDDAKVSEVPFKEVNSRAAYLLFYVQINNQNVN